MENKDIPHKIENFAYFKLIKDGDEFMGFLRGIRTQGWGFEYHISSIDPRTGARDYFNIPHEFIRPVEAADE